MVVGQTLTGLHGRSEVRTTPLKSANPSSWPSPRRLFSATDFRLALRLPWLHFYSDQSERLLHVRRSWQPVSTTQILTGPRCPFSYWSDQMSISEAIAYPAPEEAEGAGKMREWRGFQSNGCVSQQVMLRETQTWCRGGLLGPRPGLDWEPRRGPSQGFRGKTR